MKLIDAEVRVTVQSFDEEYEEYEHTEMSVSEALDFVTDEGCPPTIDAIPVEWIQAQVKNEKRAPLFRRYAEALLTIWQMEQEAQDG